MASSAESSYRLGIEAYQRGEHARAAQMFEEAAQLAPENANVVVNLGAAYRRLGRGTDAERCYRRALQLDPGHIDAHNNLGNVLRDAKRLAEAEASYRRALSLRPQFAEAWHNLGNVLSDLEQPGPAEQALREALRLKPELAPALGDLGNLLQNQARYHEAEACYRRALAIQPALLEARSNLGRALAELGRLGEAEQATREAVALGPEIPETHNNLGVVLGHLARRAEAEACYRKALGLRADYPDALNNLGKTLHELGRLSEAAQSYREVLRVKPRSAEAHANLGNVLKELGDPVGSEASYRRALSLKPDFPPAHSNLIFALDLLDGSTLQQQQSERARWHQQHAAKFEATLKPHDNAPDPERRLRIGYVSADFRRHSAYYVFAPVICRRDRGSFEAICYSGARLEDDATARLRGATDGWRSTVGIPDEQLAEQIRRDRIDVLVDLSGHSAGHRLLVFARKPAPVQVTAWGHATGTGLRTMDYFFADPVLLAPEERRLFAEEVFDLPCALCYEPPSYLPAVGPLPAGQGNPLTFGCVNRLEKVSDKVITLWGRILEGTPGARLLLKDKGLDDARLRAQLLQRLQRVGGIPADRVLLAGPSAHAEHLKIFERVDIGLDPFPQGGGVSTGEALHMGVPIVSLRGATIPSRITASMLSALGMQDWVASDDDGYVHIALAAARDLPRLARLRRELRERVCRSGYGDLDGYARAVGAAYRSMWRRWCAVQGQRSL